MCEQCELVKLRGEKPSIYNGCPICECCGKHMFSLEEAKKDLCENCKEWEDDEDDS